MTEKDPTETRTASASGGEKGVKLARYELIPTGPLQELASRFGLGAMKYDHRNWERGYEWSKSFGALMRHAQAFWAGEADDDLGDEAYRAAGLDPEDFKVEGRIPGSSHLAAVAFHALALLEWTTTHPEFDDRVGPPKSKRKRNGSAKRRRKQRAKLVGEMNESEIRHAAGIKAAEMRRRERLLGHAKEFDAELTEDAKALRAIQDDINRAVSNQAERERPTVDEAVREEFGIDMLEPELTSGQRAQGLFQFMPGDWSRYVDRAGADNGTLISDHMRRLRTAARSLSHIYAIPMTNYTMATDGEVVDNLTGHVVIPGVSPEEDESLLEIERKRSLQMGLDRDQRSL